MAGSGNLMGIGTFLNPNGTLRTPTTNNYAWYEATGGRGGLPAIRVVAGGSTSNGEVDGPYISVKPNDHIRVTIWVKTSVFTSTDAQQGSFFGWDYYGNTNVGYGILYYDTNTQMGHPTSAEQAGSGPTGYGYSINGASGQTCTAGTIVRVAFGHYTDWTQIVWDFYVPTRLCYWVYTNGKTACNGTAIDSMVCWLGVNNTNGAHSEPVWFTDPYLEVNPDPNDGLTTDTIGSTALTGTDTGYLEGTAIVPTKSGNLQSIGVNVSSSNGNGRVGLYHTKTGNVCTNLLTQSASTPLVVGWNDIPVPTVPIVGGGLYYVFLTTTGNNTYVYYDTSQPSYVQYFTYAALPDTTGTLITANATVNFRIKYSLGTSISRLITELVGYLDSKTKHKSKVRLIIEKIGNLDTRTRVKSINRTFTESAGYVSNRITDVIISGIHHYQRIIVESIGYADTRSRVKSLIRGFFEPIGNLDIVQRVKKIFNPPVNTDNPFIIYYEEET